VKLRDEQLLDALFRASIDQVGEVAQVIFLLVAEFDDGISELGVKVALEDFIDDIELSVNELHERSLIEVASGSSGSMFKLPAMAREFAKVFGTGHLYQNVALDGRNYVRCWNGLAEGDAVAAAAALATGVHGDNTKESRRILRSLAVCAAADARVYRRIPAVLRVLGADQDSLNAAYKRAVENDPGDASLRLEWSELPGMASEPKVELKVQAVQADQSNKKLASDVANLLNGVRKNNRELYSPVRWTALMGPVAEAMWANADVLEGTDWSRLAWLELNLDRVDRAGQAVERGLNNDPHNEHLQKLAARPDIKAN
jgi:hypothetical protein